MKITQLREKDGNLTLSTTDLDTFLQKIKTETKTQPVSTFRQQLRYCLPGKRCNEADRLPKVLPAAEFRKTNGVCQMKTYNGIVELTVGPLSGKSEIALVKRLAWEQPQTRLVFTGSSGRTVKIWTTFTRPNNSLPGKREEAEVFHALASILKAKGLATSVGDEGGFAPNLSSDEETIETILSAIEKAGYVPGKDFMLAMDAASSEWKSPKGKGFYKLPKAGTEFTSSELIAHWKSLVEKYPIISIEDGLDEEDWEGWQEMTRELGGKVQLVGDDLFVTNTERLAKGIQLGAGNAILIKLNQIGSVSETLEAIKMAHKAGYTAISSHRSGETEDTIIADLAVALNTCQIKTGAPSRTDRVCKYNQLLRIEDELFDVAQYPGMDAFFSIK